MGPCHGFLKSPVFSDEETKLLFVLLTRTGDMYHKNNNCPLNCWYAEEEAHKDTQQHLLNISIVEKTAKH